MFVSISSFLSVPHSYVQVQRELGLALTPLRETFIDMAITLLQLGIVQPAKGHRAEQ